MKTGRAVFLDRDGTIIEDVDYLSDLSEIKWIPGAREAVRRLNLAGFKVIVVTNQSGVARGIFSERFLMTIHARLQEDLESVGARIDAWYYCPHHPTEGTIQYQRVCSCRKPNPGLILRAAEDHALDLRSSYMIGGSEKDIAAGEGAGLTPILVLTGKGQVEKGGIVSKRGKKAPMTFPSISEAISWILKREK